MVDEESPHKLARLRAACSTKENGHEEDLSHGVEESSLARRTPRHAIKLHDFSVLVLVALGACASGPTPSSNDEGPTAAAQAEALSRVMHARTFGSGRSAAMISDSTTAG